MTHRKDRGQTIIKVTTPIPPNKADRPKIQKVRGEDEGSRPNIKQRKCGSCGALGHNSRGCNGPNRTRRKVCRSHSAFVPSQIPPTGRSGRAKGRGRGGGQQRAAPSSARPTKSPSEASPSSANEAGPSSASTPRFEAAPNH